ncbi:MAG: hypothetical protein WCF84_05885, partial [Anaerolineae bacterium]
MSSTDPITIQIIARDAASRVIQQVDTDVKQLGTDARTAGSGMSEGMGKGEEGLKALVHTGEIAGVSLRDFHHIAGAAITGVQSALSAMGEHADKSTEEMIKLADAGVKVATGFMFFGPVGALIEAVGLAIGYVVGRIQEVEAQKEALHTALVAPFEDAKKAMDEFAKEDPLKVIAMSLHMSTDELKKFLEETRPAGAEMVKAFEDAGEKVAEFKAQLVPAQAKLDELIQYGKDHPLAMDSTIYQAALRDAQNEVDKLKQYISAWSDAQDQANGKIQSTTSFIENATPRWKEYGDAVKAAFGVIADPSFDAGARKAADADAYLRAEFFRLNPAARTAAQSLDEVNAKADKLAQQGLAAATSAANTLSNALKGIVEGVLGGTDVSPADQKRLDLQKRQAEIQNQMNGNVGPATQRRLESENALIQKQIGELGPYAEKWNETDRRLKAVLNGTPITAYGQAWASMMEGIQKTTGWGLGTIEAKIADFSIFADEKFLNSGIINWDAMVGDVKDAVDRIIGKYNVVKMGVQKYLSSPEGKLQLPKLMEALGITDPKQAEKQVAQMMSGVSAGIQQGMPSGVSTTFDANTTAATKKVKEYQVLLDAAKKPIKTEVDLVFGAGW